VLPRVCFLLVAGPRPNAGSIDAGAAGLVGMLEAI